MKIKSATGLIIATTIFAAVSLSPAALAMKVQHKVSGWHMVPKTAHVLPADNWQEYVSGGYLRPGTGK